MSKELTEKLKNGELDYYSYYYFKDNDETFIDIALRIPFDDVECLAPVPTYEEYKKLINYSDDLDKTTDVLKDAQDKWLEKIKENKKLKEQLAEANELLKAYGTESLWESLSLNCDEANEYCKKWGVK